MKNSSKNSKLKKCEKKILDCFVSICTENNLNYFLAYGTLLGAIRHQGFIPWDDDVDVYLLPNDFYRFKEIMKHNNKNSEFFFQSLETEAKYCLYFDKIRLKNTKVVEEKLEYEKIHQGIYIDIFPLIPYPNDIRMQQKFHQKMKIVNLLIQSNMVDKTNYNSYGKIGKIVYHLIKIIPKRIKNKVASNILKKLLLTNLEYDNYIAYMDNKIYAKSSFEDSTFVVFEKTEYRSPKDYDHYLREIYGDYMTPPPLDKRNGHSFKEICFNCEE